MSDEKLLDRAEQIRIEHVRKKNVPFLLEGALSSNEWRVLNLASKDCSVEEIEKDGCSKVVASIKMIWVLLDIIKEAYRDEVIFFAQTFARLKAFQESIPKEELDKVRREAQVRAFMLILKAR